MQLLPIAKDGPTQSGVHVDAVIGATRGFTPGPKVGARCAACGKKGCKAHAVTVLPIAKLFNVNEARDETGKWTAEGGTGSGLRMADLPRETQRMWGDRHEDSQQITAASARLMGIEGAVDVEPPEYPARTRDEFDAQTTQAAHAILNEIAAAPKGTSKLLTGHSLSPAEVAKLTKGTSIRIPITATSDTDPAWSEAARQEYGDMGYEEGEGDMPRGQKDFSALESAKSFARGQTNWGENEFAGGVPVIFEFAKNTPRYDYGTPYGSTMQEPEDVGDGDSVMPDTGERLVAGDFTVTSIGRKTDLDEYGDEDTSYKVIRLAPTRRPKKSAEDEHSVTFSQRQRNAQPLENIAFDRKVGFNMDPPSAPAPLRALNIPHSARDIVSAGIANGGFTWNVQSGQEPTTGYVVAVQGHSSIVPLTRPNDPGQRKILAQQLVKFVRDNDEMFRANPALHLGGWHDKDHAEFVLDPVEVVGDRDQAVELGRSRNQQSIWDIAAGEEIDTGGTGDREVNKSSAGTWTTAARWLRRRVGGMGERVSRPGVRTLGEPGPRLLVVKAFNPDEARDASGKWTSSGGVGLKDAWNPFEGKSGATVDVVDTALKESNIDKLYPPSGETDATTNEEMWRGRRQGLKSALADLSSGSDGSVFEVRADKLDADADAEQDKIDNSNVAVKGPGNPATVAFWRGQAQAYRAVAAHMKAGGFTPRAHPTSLSLKASTTTQADMYPALAPSDDDEDDSQEASDLSDTLLDLFNKEENRTTAKNNVMMAITDRMMAAYGDKLDDKLAQKADMQAGGAATQSRKPGPMWRSYQNPDAVVYDQGNGSFGINLPENPHPTRVHQEGETWTSKDGGTVQYDADGNAHYKLGPDNPGGTTDNFDDILFHEGGSWKQTGGPKYVARKTVARVPDNAIRSARGGTPEAARLMREAAVSNMVHQWAQTSNDSNATSLAMQKAAVDEFALKDTSHWTEYTSGDTDSEYENNGDMYRAFLRSQYDVTQKFLKDKGLSALKLYRGVQGSPETNDADPTGDGKVAIRMRPLSSWAVDSGAAESFSGDGGTVMTANIPANRIMSTALTGNGCLGEHEVVVIGDDDTVGLYGSSEWGEGDGEDTEAQNQATMESWASSSAQSEWGQGYLDGMDEYEVSSDDLDNAWNDDRSEMFDQTKSDWLDQHPELTKPYTGSGYHMNEPNELGQEYLDAAFEDADYNEYPPDTDELEAGFSQWITDKNEETFTDYMAAHPERSDYLYEWSKQWETEKSYPNASTGTPDTTDTRLFTNNDLDIAWDNHEKGYDQDNARNDLPADPNQSQFPEFVETGGMGPGAQQVESPPPGYHYDPDNVGVLVPNTNVPKLPETPAEPDLGADTASTHAKGENWTNSQSGDVVMFGNGSAYHWPGGTDGVPITEKDGEDLIAQWGGEGWAKNSGVMSDPIVDLLTKGDHKLPVGANTQGQMAATPKPKQQEIGTQPGVAPSAYTGSIKGSEWVNDDGGKLQLGSVSGWYLPPGYKMGSGEAQSIDLSQVPGKLKGELGWHLSHAPNASYEKSLTLLPLALIP